MAMKCSCLWFLCAGCLALAGCTSDEYADQGSGQEQLVNDQDEIYAAVFSIKRDIESGDVEGLRAMHLDSEHFTKFGPRRFDRQDVRATKASETAFFSSINNAKYEINDLKIDIFGDVGIATYYPELKFVRNGQEVAVSGRQTLVFLKTDSGWKLVHEHGTVRSP